ncbi:ECF transporter S component [uncultured Enterococcus sp.]|uniref:ECF transporter S component n=1 Tax=uncultured Enterococcus sp. TaxID=167972 RepID=UPI0025D5A3BA|nr:ECF transporter S component [uncultured Enterococcus sp.]
MNQHQQLRAIIFCSFAVLFNIVLSLTTVALQLPLVFLDCIGTVFISVTLGMRYGILTGVVTNLVAGIFFGPAVIPFALFSAVVAIVVSWFAKKEFTYPRAIVTGLVAAILASFVSTILRLMIYGGYSFSRTMTNLVVSLLHQSGENMFMATYWSSVLENGLDKVISCLLVAWLVHLPRLKRYFNL